MTTGGGTRFNVCSNVVKPQDAIDCGHIQRALSIGDAHRHVQAAGDSEYRISPLVAIFVDDSIDSAFLLTADEQGAVLPKCHTARIRNIVRIDLDGKTGRQRDRIEREGTGIDPVLDEEESHKREDQRNNTTHHIAFVQVVPVHNGTPAHA